MQKGFAPILILVGILVLLAVVGGIYYFGKAQTPKPQTQNTVVPLTSQSTPVPDETVGWKTYTDPQGLYSFRYPDVGIKKEGVNDVVVGTNYSDPQTEDIFQKAFYLVIHVEKNSSNTSLDQIEEKLRNMKIDKQRNSFYGAGNIRPYINGEISGLIYQEYYDNGDQTSSVMKVVSIHNAYRYTFSYSNLGQLAVAGGEKIVQQILSTFKFLDQNQTIDTSNWKTYANKNIGFSINYPTKWQVILDKSSKVILGFQGAGPSFFAEMYPNPKKLGLKDWFIENKSTLHQSGVDFIFSDITIDNRSGLKAFGGVGPFVMLDIPTQESILVMGGESLEYTKIISTFKFTN